MKAFKTATKDSKTGYELYLSEASYNMAVEWLNLKTKQTGRCVWKCKAEDDGLIHIYVGKQEGNLEKMFFYDEERGYLLGE